MLTRTGTATLVVVAALLTLGSAFRYIPLLALAGALALAFGVAALTVLRRTDVTAERSLDPERVTVGQPSRAELVLTNRGRRRIGGGVAYETFGDAFIPVAVPELAPGESEVVDHQLPTTARGVYDVGPLVLNRSDPFGFLQRGAPGSPVAKLWVHPLVRPMEPFPSGLQRDLDGPNSGEAPEGGIAFQNLREYVVGDDLRLIHWRSSAKIGELMVRHNVDSHQPRTLVILDTRYAVHSPESFEEAISAAASIVAASIKRRFPFRLRTTCGTDMDNSRSRTSIFDQLAELGPSTKGDIGQTAELSRREQGGYSLAVVTGTATAEDLIGINPIRHKYRAITIGRLGSRTRGQVVELPGAVVINARTCQDFATAWNHRMRR